MKVAYFDNQTSLFITDEFIFYKGNFYSHNCKTLTFQHIKIDMKVNKFIFTFMSKLKKQYYRANFNYYINKLHTEKQYPFNPIITSGMLKFKGNTIDYCQMPLRMDNRVFRNILNYLSVNELDYDNLQYENLTKLENSLELLFGQLIEELK